MSFVPQLPPEPEAPDEPGVMHIGGPRGRRVWEITRWALVILAIAAVMVVLFIRFGAPVVWAVILVGFMLTYMALMGRWASGDHERR